MNYARFSPCKTYRYELRRTWSMEASINRKCCMWIMLNPSTADEYQDDPTIRRCIDFSKSWGFDEMVVGNLYGYRATKPADMWNAHNNGIDVVGAENLERLRIMASYSTRIVCAWGSNADEHHAEDVLMMLRSIAWKFVCYLHMNADNQPRHPLYVKGNCVPKFYRDLKVLP